MAGRSPNTNVLMAALSIFGNLPNEIMARSLETIGRDHHANALQFKGRSRWLSLDLTRGATPRGTVASLLRVTASVSGV
jgi:hypothetical protein